MKTLEQIKQLREDKKKELDLRVNPKANTNKKHILVVRIPTATKILFYCSLYLTYGPLILNIFK